MTQTSIQTPQAPPTPASPPSYEASSNFPDVPEKPHVCPKHGPSQTPNIDQHLRQFQVVDRLRAIAPLNNLDGASCTRCNIETATTVLSNYMKDVKAARKSGQLSKQDNRALRAEAKGLMRGVKRDLKAAWRSA